MTRRARGEKRTIRNKLIALFCLFVSVAFLETGCPQNQNTASEKDLSSQKLGVEVGNIAPDFRVANLKGGESSLSDYRGKVVLLNFWATWCGPCKAEMPSMEALYQSYPREDFEILAVSIDIDKDAPIQSFIEDFGFTFPVLLDTLFEVNDRYQIRVVPTSVVVNREGVITHRLLGAKDWNAPDSKLFLEKLISAG